MPGHLRPAKIPFTPAACTGSLTPGEPGDDVAREGNARSTLATHHGRVFSMAQDPLTTAVSVPERLPGHTPPVRPRTSRPPPDHACAADLTGCPGTRVQGAARTVFHL